MARIASGNMSRVSLKARCLPPRENGWQGGPPETSSILFLYGLEIDLAHVALGDFPPGDGLDSAVLVLADGVAAIAVPLNDVEGMKARQMQPYPKASGTGE